MIIAIDGPAGSGKSTAAKSIAQKLRFKHIDTGAMYRAVTWKAGQLGIDLKNENEVAQVAEELDIQFEPGPHGQTVKVDGKDVTGLLKSETIGKGAATVAAHGKVREILVAKQQEMGKDGNIVMEGRDIGTVVFPNAKKKFFLDASPEERGKRRYLELKDKHPDVDLKAIVEQIRQRDYEDRNRKVSPLKPAPDAICLDTTNLNLEEVINNIMRQIESDLPH